ncbi:MAG TPA: hypothetical protein VJH23_03440 [archaeon]|nr:hypothetical protein [archaeon]
MPITVVEAGLIAVGFVAFSGALVYFYRFSNKKLLKKILELRRSDEEVRQSIEHLNKARHSEFHGLKGRMDRLEERLDVLLMKEGEHKELAKEKIRVAKRQ